MKTLCVILAAVALLSVPLSVLAGSRYSPAEGELAGTQALQFSVESHLSLGEFQGQMFSYQRFLTDTRAIRVAATLDLDLDKVDEEASYSGGEQVGTAETTSWGHSVTLKVQMQFYRGDGPLRFFWGAGPKVTFTDSHGEDVDFNAYSDDLEYYYFTSDTNSWRVGIQGFTGVEWFINDTFSLHAEYGVTGGYYFKDHTTQRVFSEGPEYTRTFITKTRSPEFDSDGVLFGLSARF